MRVLTALFVLMTSVLVLQGCTLRVGNVEASDPRYNASGVVVGTLEIRDTPYHGPRHTIMTCTNEGALRRQLDRVVPVRALTRGTAREMRDNQISHLTGWGCNERVVRGRPTYEWVGSYQSPSGQRFTIYRVWQRDGNTRRAFNLGLTAR
ncbi:MAG: hypothetical protein ACK42D_01845 [Candidatus Paceibacteria bacterium]